MLLIIYAFFVGIFGIIGSIYPLVVIGGELKQKNYTHFWKFILGIIADILGVVFVGVMINFLTYHFYLVNNNKVLFYFFLLLDHH